MVNPYTRTPTLLAQTVATLDELSGNRTVLGIGAANQMLVEEFHGERFDRPLTRTRETIEAVRALLSGGRVDYHGETISIDGAMLDFPPPRSDVPVYMGVTGPKMLKLAGAIADGVVLNVFVSEGYVKNALDLIDEGAREASRERPDVGMVPAFSIDANGESAKAAVKPMVAEYVCNLPGLEQARRAVGDPFFDRDDVREEVMIPVRRATEAEGSASAAKHVPDWVVEELAAAGTAEECVTKLAEFFDYDLDFVVPSVMGGNVGYGIDVIADGFDLNAD